MPPSILQSTVLHKYKTLLAKLSGKGYFEEPGTVVQQAKSKFLYGVKRKRISSGVDPFRAFSRLQRWFLEAKVSGKEKAQEHLRWALESGGVLKNSEIKKALKPRAPAELIEVFGKDGFIRTVLLFSIGAASRLFMQGVNSTTVQGAEHLSSALSRPPGQPLITVSNHVGALDDPLVVAAIVPGQTLTQPQNIRWTLCATDRCFSNPLFSGFFRATKVLPVERGSGLKQLGMDAAQYRLNEGDWVHIFPEGTRSRNGELKPPRPGIGKLVAACGKDPLVVPFVHSGMEKVMPVGQKVPKTGQTVRVLVGEPINFTDLISAAKQEGWSDRDLYGAITHRVGQSLASLWSRLEEKPLPSWASTQPAFPLDLDGDLWRQRCRKGMWSVGYDWRCLSSTSVFTLTQLATIKANFVEIMREMYWGYCVERQRYAVHVLGLGGVG